jgi:hypothetical protein
MKLLPLLVLPLLLQEQDPGEKALARMVQLMDEGHYVEGRALARQIVRKYAKTTVAERAQPYVDDNAFLRVIPIEVTGPAGNRVDIAIMPDGLEYENRTQERWEKEGDAILRSLFTSEVFREYATCFNLYRIHAASKESRLNKADGPVLTYLMAREEEGEILVDGFKARDTAARSGAKDRLAMVQVRPAGNTHGSSSHGVAVVGSPRPSPQQVLHAWGHSLAGLADEVGGSRDWGGMTRSERKDPPPVPNAPNVSTTKDPAEVPWAHWLAAKKAGDRRAARIDVIEGAARHQTKAWRPIDETQCVMNSGSDFCPVCRESLVLMFYTYIRPIDDATPCVRTLTAEAGASVDLFVLPLRPATHRLKVQWVLERTPPENAKGDDAKGRVSEEGAVTGPLRCGNGLPGTRNGEGPSWRAPVGEPVEGTLISKPGQPEREVLSLTSAKFGKGRFRVTAVVRDMTEWVLKDSQNLLVDWRTWVVELK